MKEKYNKPGNVFVGVTHRLDRPVSGLVVFAKTSKALARLNDMFRNGEVKKSYWAIVKRAPEKESDELVHYLVRNEKSNKSVAYDREKPGAKRAVLDYKILARGDRYTSVSYTHLDVYKRQVLSLYYEKKSYEIT